VGINVSGKSGADHGLYSFIVSLASPCVSGARSGGLGTYSAILAAVALPWAWQAVLFANTEAGPCVVSDPRMMAHRTPTIGFLCHCAPHAFR
jgi:hypothetical protein